MPLPYLESLLITVDLFGGLASAAFALPENNDRHLFKSAGESSSSNPNIQPLKSASIGLCFNQQPKDITRGFVFGSDPRSCDVLLANTKGTGISANHFSISIDWASRIPIITCLSGNDLRAKVIGTRTSTILSKSKWQRLLSDTITNVHVAENLGAQLFNPFRGDLQAAYDRNLQDYFLEYKNAVPELANISLRDSEVTPLIVHRCPGLDGKEYYTTGKIETGDPDYDAKVFLYDAKCRPALDALMKTQGLSGASDTGPKYSAHANDVDEWLDNSKGNKPGQIFVVKHFRDHKRLAMLPPRFPELRRLYHYNVEDLIDLITETSAFMVVTEIFSHITLHALHQEEPLSTEETGFVLGQTFAALQYLHDQRWTHGNLDPRSIHVMSRKHLWIKLIDTALSDYADLGKPNGYHAMYASQASSRANHCPADIWSAGVMALQFLLPNGLPHRATKAQYRWVLQLERLAVHTDRNTGTDATTFIRKVLKCDFDERPTATAILEDPWIVQNRGEAFVSNPHFQFPTPQGSRHTSVGPSDAFSRQGSTGPSNWSIQSHIASDSRHTSVGPSHRHGSFASLKNATDGLHQQKYDPISRAPSPNLSRQSSIDPTLRAMLESHPYTRDDYNDFDGDRGTSKSRSSRFTTDPLARTARVPTGYELGDEANAPTKQRPLHSQPRRNGGRSPAVRSEYGSTTTQSSRFTANPLAREPQPRTPTPYDSEDNSGMLGRLRYLRSQPRSSGGRSPVGENEHGSTTSQSRRSTDPPSRTSRASTVYNADDDLSVVHGSGSLGSQSRSSWAEPVQREAQIEEDSGDETETGEHPEPVKRKPRRGPVIPPLDRNLRSSEKKPALRVRDGSTED